MDIKKLHSYIILGENPSEYLKENNEPTLEQAIKILRKSNRSKIEIQFYTWIRKNLETPELAKLENEINNKYGSEYLDLKIMNILKNNLFVFKLYFALQGDDLGITVDKVRHEYGQRTVDDMNVLVDQGCLKIEDGSYKTLNNKFKVLDSVSLLEIFKKIFEYEHYLKMKKMSEATYDFTCGMVEKDDIPDIRDFAKKNAKRIFDFIQGKLEKKKMTGTSDKGEFVVYSSFLTILKQLIVILTITFSCFLTIPSDLQAIGGMGGGEPDGTGGGGSGNDNTRINHSMGIIPSPIARKNYDKTIFAYLTSFFKDLIDFTHPDSIITATNKEDNSNSGEAPHSVNDT